MEIHCQTRTLVSRLEAENDDTPMPYGPDGTEERIATVEINGNGEADFGEFWLYDRGIYKYYVTEINGGESNYKYDPTRYTVIFDVHDNNGQLVAFRKIVREDRYRSRFPYVYKCI